MPGLDEAGGKAKLLELSSKGIALTRECLDGGDVNERRHDTSARLPGDTDDPAGLRSHALQQGM